MAQAPRRPLRLPPGFDLPQRSNRELQVFRGPRLPTRQPPFRDSLHAAKKPHAEDRLQGVGLGPGKWSGNASSLFYPFHVTVAVTAETRPLLSVICATPSRAGVPASLGRCLLRCVRLPPRFPP